jgi:truncated hemoglobin YjbI
VLCDEREAVLHRLDNACDEANVVEAARERFTAALQRVPALRNTFGRNDDETALCCDIFQGR